MATIKTPRIVCDEHLTAGEEVDGQRRRFTFDGVRYSRDLCDSCYGEHVQPLITLLSGKVADTPKRKRNGKAKSNGVGKQPTAATIRAWAAEAGVECAPTGRVPKDVREQYARAQAS